MPQQFHTRNYSVRDFEEWYERDELVLAPKFQRRDVWNPKARSYLIDTIVRGKPIPKIYMRQSINPQTRRTIREIVDGQQRLRTVLNFLEDGFKISKAHHEDFGGKRFSGLDKNAQADILKYEFVVDLLQDMPDSEIYDVFARINTYAEKLKPQELRHAKWFGEFRSSVYLLAKEFVPFFEANKIFTSKQILRMAEAEFTSELLLAMQEGIRAGSKAVIDKAYKDYDDKFPNRRTHERRFRETVDTMNDIVGADLPQMRFRATRLLYPLFCAIFNLKFGLRRLGVPKMAIKKGNQPRMKAALEEMDALIENAESGNKGAVLSADEQKFYGAYDEHWVHADKRTILTQYVCKQLTKAVKG